MTWITCSRVAAWTKRPLRPLLIVLVLVTAISCLAAPAARASSAANTEKFAISSTTGWQQTPFTLKAGEVYALGYVSGSWTVDYRNFPWVGPGGYSNSVDSQIYQGCKYLPSRNYAVLLGAVGNGQTFAIGTGGTFQASTSGPLWLRINDDDACLGDNAGSVTMKIETQPAMVTKVMNYAGYSVGPLAGTDRYALAYWKVPKVSCKNAPGKNYKGRAAVWVGLWGGKFLMQAGTNSLCIKQKSGYKTRYYAWFELVPQNPNTLGMTVKHGDSMFAQVEYAGKRNGKLRFWFVVADLTRNTQRTRYVLAPRSASLANSAYQAGAIVEGLGNHLAKFSPITVSNIGFGAAFNLLPAITRYKMGKKTCLLIICVDNLLASTGPWSNYQFTVTWKKYKL